MSPFLYIKMVMMINKFICPVLFLLVATVSPGQGVDFKKQIAPILSSKCNSCHTAKKKESDKKPKAGLALNTSGGIRAGRVIEPGDASSSELFIRVSLPKTDEELMPPTDDGGPLSAKEIALIKKWIDDGARFGSGSGGDIGKIAADLDVAKVMAMPMREPNADAVAHLEGLGATISQLAVNLPQQLVVEWISTYHKTTDKEIEQILHIAPNVVEVDLSRTKVTDEGLKHIGKLARLTHLNLSRTQITDKGLEHLSGLRSLQHLNLYGTGVSNAALPTLAKHRKLKALYTWQTKITADGLSKLRKALPDAKLVLETDAKSNRYDNLDNPDNKFDF